MTTDRNSRSPWTASRDEVFFRIVQAAFPPRFLASATALLASYDDVCETNTLREVTTVAGPHDGTPRPVAHDALAAPESGSRRLVGVCRRIAVTSASAPAAAGSRSMQSPI
jgi:hypothetical protein